MQGINIDSYIEPDAKWQTGFLTQYVTLTKRNFLSQKQRYLSKLNFGQLMFLAIFSGLVWFRTTRTEDTSKDRFGIVSIVRSKTGLGLYKISNN